MSSAAWLESTKRLIPRRWNPQGPVFYGVSPWRFGHTSWATVASQCCPCARGRSRAGTREAWAAWPAGWWDWGRRPAGGPSVGAPCWPWSEPPEWDTKTLRHVVATVWRQLMTFEMEYWVFFFFFPFAKQLEASLEFWTGVWSWKVRCKFLGCQEPKSFLFSLGYITQGHGTCRGAGLISQPTSRYWRTHYAAVGGSAVNTAGFYWGNEGQADIQRGERVPIPKSDRAESYGGKTPGIKYDAHVSRQSHDQGRRWREWRWW